MKKNKARSTGLGVSQAFLFLCICWGCVEHSRRSDRHEHVRRDAAYTAPALQEAIDNTMAEARRAVDDLGVSEAAVPRIAQALARLATMPGLLDPSRLRPLHGGAGESVVLASEGEDRLTLNLVRFPEGQPTPIHDHGTWAVAYVVQGHDRYTHYERVDDQSDPRRAELRVKYERLLGPGDFVHWFGPPHDIHSQQAEGGAVWELVLLGKNPFFGTLHYFDAQTGRVTERKPQ